MSVNLDFAIDGVEPERSAASPLLLFKLRIAQTSAAGMPVTPIQSVLLRCQVRLEPARRRYTAPEQVRLLDLYGAPERWGKTLRPSLWTFVSVFVPPFTEGCTVDLPVACSYDFNLATTKYFAALGDGDVPLCFLFSGTIFYQDNNGALQVAQIAWEKEASFRLPVLVWQDLMDRYYPNSAWLYLRRDVFDRLHQYKSRHGLATWEQAVEQLLAACQEPVA